MQKNDTSFSQISQMQSQSKSQPKRRLRRILSDDEDQDALQPPPRPIPFASIYRNPADVTRVINLDNPTFIPSEMNILIREQVTQIQESIRRLPNVLMSTYVHDKERKGYYFITHDITDLKRLYPLAVLLDKILGKDAQHAALVYTSYTHVIPSHLHQSMPRAILSLKADKSISTQRPMYNSPGSRSNFLSQRVLDHGIM